MPQEKQLPLFHWNGAGARPRGTVNLVRTGVAQDPILFGLYCGFCLQLEFYEHIFMTSEFATVSDLIMQQINQNRFLW